MPPGGFRIQIEGLTAMVEGLARGYREFDEVWADILRGPVGDDLLREIRRKVAAHRKTGKMLADTKKDVDRGRGIRVGVLGDRAYIGTFLESGTRAHEIQPRGYRQGTGRRTQKNLVLKIDGVYARDARHPGTRAQRIAGTALRTRRNQIEELVVDEIEKRLGRVMGVHG